MNQVKQSWLELIAKYPQNTINDIFNKLYDEDKSNIQRQIFPKQENILRCFKYFDVDKTKVVILGQDPYHAPNQATGLCFGIDNSIRIPPSLKNIAKELRSDLNIDLSDNSLEHWAKQGILMLNASLSVFQGKPASQMKLWSEFTTFIISELNKQSCPIIFVAWGAFAHEKFKNIDVCKHHLLISSHPSPLSVYKKYKEFPAYSGSKPFSKINKILEEYGSKRIDW